MSIDLTIFPTGNRFAGVDIRAAFGDFATPTDFGLRLEYDAENDALVYFELDESGTTDSFTVNRPCGDERLYESLFAFLTKHEAVLACGECDPPMRVTSEAALQAALAIMPGAEEQIVVATSPEDLLGW